MKYFAKESSRLCVDFAFPEFAETPLDLQRLLPKPLFDNDLAALAEVVKAAANDPQTFVETDEVLADLIVVLSEMDALNPGVVDVLLDPSAYQNDPDSLCESAISFYSKILALPNENRIGTLLHYLFNQE